MSQIPKIIHQTFETKDLSPAMVSILQTWKDKNPNYTFKFYDKEDRVKFMSENFEDKVLNAYNNLNYGAFKADLWRYCILYKYGGCYTDMDTICINGIDVFLNNETEICTPIDLTRTYHLFNSFISVKPGHPIMKHCIDKCVDNALHIKNCSDNRDYTGPGVLGMSVNKYLERHEKTYINHENVPSSITLLNFVPRTEYVYDKDNKHILLQNKNGNKDIKKIYDKECELNNIDCEWSKGNPYTCMKTTLGIVNCGGHRREQITQRVLNTGINHIFSCHDDGPKHDCGEGHQRVVKKLLEIGQEYIIVCEDDVVFARDLDERIKTCITLMEDNKIDTLLCGYLMTRQPKNPLSSLKELTLYPSNGGYSGDAVYGTQMYILTRSRAEEFLKIDFKKEQEKGEFKGGLPGSDFAINRVGNVALVYPPLAVELFEDKFSHQGHRNFHLNCQKFLLDHKIHNSNTINYVCPIGTLCRGDTMIKSRDLKKCSYPFDSIFSSEGMVSHCMFDDFKIFLDKSYHYTVKNGHESGHTLYDNLHYGEKKKHIHSP